MAPFISTFLRFSTIGSLPSLEASKLVEPSSDDFAQKTDDPLDAKFAFLLFDNVEELDFIGPWEVIGVWKQFFNGPKKMLTVSQNAGLIKCSKGLQISSDYSFSGAPEFDYLMIPGGWGARLEAKNQELIAFIRERSKKCKAVLSVCTGSFLMQSAGLLDNKNATTHWQSLERLKKFPRTSVIEKRVVKDGNLWTSAGISSGIDMSLDFIADTVDEKTAGLVQLQMEYFPSGKLYGDLHNSIAVPEYIKEILPAADPNKVS